MVESGFSNKNETSTSKKKTLMPKKFNYYYSNMNETYI